MLRWSQVLSRKMRQRSVSRTVVVFVQDLSRDKGRKPWVVAKTFSEQERWWCCAKVEAEQD